MVTQKDVASLAGVSFITVSRVINNEGNVKEETRKKVQDAIEKLGYVPNYAGLMLNSGKTYTIGVLSSFNFHESARNLYLMSLLHGIETVCQKNNYDLLFSSIPKAQKDSNYDYLRPYKQKKVDGIIYIGLKETPALMQEQLETLNLPCVAVGDRPESDLISWIDANNFDAGYNTVKEILNYGHKKIALITTVKSYPSLNLSEREQGFIKAVKDFNLGYEPNDYIIRIDPSKLDTFEKVQEFFNSPICTNLDTRPTAIFCNSDAIVPPCVEALEDMKLQIPQDVSIVGFDGYINSVCFKLNVATNKQPLEQMGEKAASLILSQIQSKKVTKETFKFDVSFVHGDSLTRV